MGKKGAFDEITGFGDGARPGLEGVGAWLSDTSTEELARRQQSAEATFRQLGITFTVYGDGEAGDALLTLIVLPVITLGLIYAGTVARLARAGVIESLGQDFARTARAKGLSERVVVWKHALRLGVIPAITYLGPAMAALIAGSFVVETIFQIPGLGFYFVDSVTSRDAPVLCGLLVFYVAITVVMNLLVDLVQALLDPRVREGR